MGAAACSSGGSERAVPGIADALEQEIFGGPGGQYRLRVQQLVVECARLNGLDGWSARDVAELVGSETIGSGGAHPSGLQGRDLVQAVGTGIVDSYIDAMDAASDGTPLGGEPSTVQDVFTLAENDIMFNGPVAIPNGQQTPSGCIEWAQGVGAIEFDLEARDKLEREYSKALGEHLANSSAMLEVEAGWSRCMAESGFPGIEEQGDQVALVAEEADRLLAGETTAAAALSFDRQISLAAWDCAAIGSDERYRIRDQFAADFAEERGL